MLDLVNVYILPIGTSLGDIHQQNFDAQHFFSQVIELADTDVVGDLAIILCGDFNAHDHLWQSQGHHDKLGREIAKVASDNNFKVANDPHCSTYVVKNGQTSPDITMPYGPITISNWTLEEPFCNSHHHVLSYDIKPLFALPGLPKFASDISS